MLKRLLLLLIFCSCAMDVESSETSAPQTSEPIKAPQFPYYEDDPGPEGCGFQQLSAIMPDGSTATITIPLACTFELDKGDPPPDEEEINLGPVDFSSKTNPEHD